MNLKSTIHLILLNLPLYLFSQGENMVWLFGNAAHFTFEKGYPSYVIGKPNMNTFEGSTSVSDAKGHLLFYSDGLAVYDRNDRLMPNGDQLMGDKSSTSSAVAVPFPGKPHLYYLFCVDYNFSEENKGLTYNLIDMSLNNGYGAVVVKNQVLAKPCDEKIAVTRTCDSKGFWVVVHQAFTDNFLSFQINELGLQVKPVISLIPSYKGKRPEIGYLKFSPGGRFLVNACTLEENLQIFGFDKKNGRLNLLTQDSTKYKRLSKPEIQTYYGVAFSDNEKYLYVSLLESGEIYQYDLSLPIQSVLKNRYLVFHLKRFSGALQMAADKKIYVANGYSSSYLHSIERPNLPKGSCLFKYQSVYLGTMAIAHLGLPTLIESGIYYHNLGKDVIIEQTSNFRLDAKIDGGKYLWSTGETTKTIRVSDTGGIYWLSVYDPQACMYYTDTIRVLVRKNFTIPIKGIQNYEFCSNARDVEMKFSSEEKEISFIWFCDNPFIGLAESGRGDISGYQVPYSTEKRYAKIKVYPLRNGFIGNPDSFYLTIKPSPVLSLENLYDYTYCAGETSEKIQVRFSSGNGLIHWYNDNRDIGLPDSGYNQIFPFLLKGKSETITANIRFYGLMANCPSIPVYTSITVNPNPAMKPIPDMDICSGKPLPPFQFEANLPDCSFYFESPFNPKNKIEYTYLPLFLMEIPKTNHLFTQNLVVYPKHRNCMGEGDTFQITVRPSPQAAFEVKEELGDTSYTNPLIHLSNRSSAYSKFSWYYNGQINRSDPDLSMRIPSNTAYQVSLSVENDYGCMDVAEKKLYLEKLPQVFIPTAFSPNGDGVNDSLLLSCYALQNYTTSIYNAWGECVQTTENQTFIWDGRLHEEDSPQAVYFWVFEGIDRQGKPVKMRGTVHLLR